MHAKTTHRASAATSVAGLLLAAGCASSAKPAAQPAATTPSASSSSSPGPAATSVSIGTAEVKGTSMTVLTAPDGRTLYYFTPDNAAGKATCSGACASAWPPLIGADGKQITYHGHPLYEFAQDKAAGQAVGQGLMGKWYVATPDLAAGAGAPPQPATTPTSTPTPASGYDY